MRRYMRLWLCVCVASLLCIIVTTACSNQNQETDEDKTNDYPPMVMFEGVLYSATSGQDIDISSLKLDEVGVVSSYTADGLPSNNNQANDDLVGCKIYRAEDLPDYIFVLNNGDYSPYSEQSN